MNNRYEIINKIEYGDDLYPTNIIILLADVNGNTYNCIIEKENDAYKDIYFMDDNINRFDLAKTLFEHSIKMYNIIPKKFISREMDDVIENYYPGKAVRCVYKDDESYNESYLEEEERIKNINSKKLIRAKR